METPREIDPATLPDLGWVIIEWVGEENVYVRLPGGERVFWKALG